ncbi:MAG: ATP synthase F1 subunit delta [Bacteroidetes bacterium RIFCSPLOWO2_02_FULL_36_8]|nr:MAG: ATP synthase F1 subunit delta [Bacteroidetes bacterium RIFCSPLOWO2_02_FULL_36_8]OFY69553.1 MAG: ATP synthase F1 subunit delta [Bacteroidetes bacterium RIFCSPLOWO2_12_FULL_37_12]
MPVTKATARYARSLLELATEQGNLEAVYSDMRFIYKACKDNRELMLLLKSPIVNPGKKLNILTDVFRAHICDLTYEILKILTRKRRENLLYEIAADFFLQYQKLKGETYVTVTSAIPLTESQKEKIRILLSHITGLKAEIKEKLDTSLIGGVMIESGDLRMDLSVSGGLKKVKKEFEMNLFEKWL